MIEGAIFDLGSTLIHFDGDWAQIWHNSLEELRSALQDAGVQAVPDGLIPEFARRMDSYRRDRLDDHHERTTANILVETLIALGIPVPDEETLSAALERMYVRTEDYWKPVPGLESTLGQLQDQGLRMALLSNAGDEANVQRLIDRAGIRQYLDPILISAALGVRKPASEPFELILSRWQMAPGQVVMVGDRLDQDILGAQRVGLHQIWLRAYAEPDQANACEPELSGEALTEVPSLIERLNSKGGPAWNLNA